MGTVLDDVTSESIDVQHVRRRVDDWEKRLNGLYAMIGGWLPDEWEARDGELVTMHAELMRKFNVGSRRMPTLELVGKGNACVRFAPRGLWIIGSNGWVDVNRERGAHRYLIVDKAENFEEPEWQAAPANRRCDRGPVTRDWLMRVLR